MNLWERIKQAMAILWYGLESYGDIQQTQKINLVLGDKHTVAVKRALEKLKNEVPVEGRLHMYSEATGEAKREEVLTWAKYYATKLGVKEPSDWRFNFALEYLVGKDKGIL